MRERIHASSQAGLSRRARALQLLARCPAQQGLSLLRVYSHRDSVNPDPKRAKTAAIDTICSVGAWRLKLRRVSLAYLWSILVWVGFSPILAAENRLQLSDRGLHSPGYWTLLLVNGAWCLTAALLTPPIFYLVRRYPISKRAGLWRLAGYLLGGIPYLAVSVVIRWIILPPWNLPAQKFGSRSAQALIVYLHLFGVQIWDYVVSLVAAHAYGYFHRSQIQELERTELQQALATSELQSLKSQLHPHFLFNTLQGISMLIASDPRQARAMLLKLSALLRTALAYGSLDLITLADELKFVESYLELQKMRLEDRLWITWEVQPDTRQMLVPQLILQPLVENAIVHGIACCREGGWIQICARRTESTLEITIRNSVGATGSSGMGLGLRNTRARLKHLYGNEGKFTFAIDAQNVAIASLLLPGFSRQEGDAMSQETQGQRSA